MYGDNLTHLSNFLISVPFEVEEPSGEALKPWDNKALRRAIIRAESIQCVIVGLGIYGPQNGRFVGGNSGQLASPAREIVFFASPFLLDFSEKAVIITLQHLVSSGFAAWIENELKCANNRNSDRRVNHLDAKSPENVASGCRAQDDHEKAEASGPELKSPPARRMVERVADYIEPQIFSIIIHRVTYFLAGAGADGFGAGAEGCLGPGPASGLPELVGCRGPRLFISIFPVRRITPNDFSIFILIVSMWFLHMVMKVSARVRARAETAFYQFSGWLS